MLQNIVKTILKYILINTYTKIEIINDGIIDKEDSKKIYGSVLCEHIRSIDYETRNVRFIEKASENDLLSVIMLSNACIE